MIFSILTVIIVGGFAILKFIKFVNHDSSIISKVYEQDQHQSLKDSIDLKAENFKLAFAVRDKLSGDVKLDPSLVELKGIIYEKEGPVEKAIHEIDVHLCTE